jgi:L-cysteine desulfidase
VAIGDMGRVGMKSTDVEILNIMLDKIKPLENKN